MSLIRPTSSPQVLPCPFVTAEGRLTTVDRLSLEMLISSALKLVPFQIGIHQTMYDIFLQIESTTLGWQLHDAYNQYGNCLGDWVGVQPTLNRRPPLVALVYLSWGVRCNPNRSQKMSKNIFLSTHGFLKVSIVSYIYRAHYVRHP